MLITNISTGRVYEMIPLRENARSLHDIEIIMGLKVRNCNKFIGPSVSIPVRSSLNRRSSIYYRSNVIIFYVFYNSTKRLSSIPGRSR